MRIGCLQFAPQVGEVNENINKADAVLDQADPEYLDLLVLPELAFSGYNFSSLRHISPCLELQGSGVSSLWATSTALKHDCAVIAGYPEKVDLADSWPANPEYYNSAVVVNSDGDVVANYRKAHLYYTDETWALEGSSGFLCHRIPGLGTLALGICMDLNPYRFEAPWDAFEFSTFALQSGARLVVVSMAWLTQENPEMYNKSANEPDMDTLMYWVGRLEPIIRIESNQEVIVVFANRCGSESGATYAGTSAIIGIVSGEVRVYGMLGRGETDLLVVDTDNPPFAKLVYRPEGVAAAADTEQAQRLETEEAGADQVVDDVPIVASNPATSHRPVEEHQDPVSGGTEPLQQRKHIPSYKRTDLTIRLPEKSSKYLNRRGKPTGNEPCRDLDHNSGHARRRSEGQSKTQWISQVAAADEADFDDEPDHSSVNSEPPPSAMWRNQHHQNYLAADGRRYGHDAGGRSISSNNADNVVIAIDSLVTDAQPRWSKQAPPTKWIAHDDPELAFVEGEDPDAPFHDPTGNIGKWVQMIQTPRKPPTEAQRHESSRIFPHPGRSTENEYTSPPEKSKPFNHHKPLKPHRVMRDNAYGNRRSQSATGESKTDFEAVCRKLEDMAQVEEKLADEHSHLGGSNVDSHRSHYTHKQHMASGSRRQNRQHSKYEDESDHKSGSDVSVAFAMNVPMQADTSLHTRQQEPSRIFFSPVETDYPILRPVSSNRLRQGHRTEDSVADRQKSEIANRRYYREDDTGHDDISRTYSRGRQLAKDKDTGENYNPSHSHTRTQTPKSRRQVSVEPTNLAQYHLIEEVPSATCPVHAPRSRSRARNKSTSRQRSTHTRSRPDFDSSRVAGKHELGRSYSSQVKSTRDASRADRQWIAQDVRVERSASATPGHERLRRGAKTPVPMMLVSKRYENAP
ncbi:hypothetical protein QQS21_007356 [Conoideocrella luteorostrata]|uniref:CN hydrolase domain-containing protein n=1 Tax=Conoideocrella luteorostrata TaxID=1105319 RepID=A0AAJ0CKU7_9HYPO|nr:hypothetical protein QQS21_007356 [Conoideocrella luteorostrata]